jgi:hypothetical protein
VSARSALLPEVVNRRGEQPQVELPLATEGVLRYVWECKFGSMLIEVRGGRAFVDGDLVEPAPQAP